MTTTAAHTADVQYLVRNAMTTVKRGRAAFSLNRLLRATWLGGLVGSVGAGGLSYIWYAYSNEEVLRTRRIQVTYNNDRIRADDHALTGIVLMGVFTPAVLWNRAHILNLVLGGAGFGSSIGLLTHYGRSIRGDPAPKSEIPVISTAGQ